MFKHFYLLILLTLFTNFSSAMEVTDNVVIGGATATKKVEEALVAARYNLRVYNPTLANMGTEKLTKLEAKKNAKDPKNQLSEQEYKLREEEYKVMSSGIFSLLSRGNLEFRVGPPFVYTPFMRALITDNNLDLAQVLAEAGANINAKSLDSGRTALHIATILGKVKAVKYLVGLGADINSCDNTGDRPLLSSIINNEVEIFKILVKSQADLNIRNLNSQDSPLHEAAQCNRRRITRYLLTQKNVNKEAMNSIQRTPLHIAARYGHVDIARYLIKAGASVNAVDIDHRTPLMLAAKQGFFDVVKLLIAHGVDVLLEDFSCKKAYDIAITSPVRELLKSEEEKQEKKKIEQHQKEKSKNEKSF